MMIFYRNAGSILKKISLKILFQPHFDYRNNLFSSFLKSIGNMKSLLSWFTTGKSIPPTLKTILKLNEALRYERVLGLPSLVNTPMNIGGMLRQPLNHFIKTQTWAMGNSPTSGSAGNYSPAQSVLEHKSPATLHPVNFLPNNNETIKFPMPLNKPFKGNKESNASDSTISWKRMVFDKKIEDFYFHKRQNIEQEVEEIKRIVVETKETVLEKSMTKNFPGEIDIKRHFDINRISDQVYQNIERRVRMERERRGL
jgi:hypothetical protein